MQNILLNVLYILFIFCLFAENMDFNISTEKNNSLDWNLKGAIAMELGNLIARYNRWNLHGKNGAFESYKSLKQIRLILSAYLRKEELKEFHTQENNGDIFFNLNEFANNYVINRGFQTKESFLKTEEGKKILKDMEICSKKFDLRQYAEDIMALLKRLGFAFGVKEDSSQMRM